MPRVRQARNATVAQSATAASTNIAAGSRRT
jgi:hypothetical protein